ncbi:valine--tRNA ligase [Aquisediminimonas profunda]|uniref:valine--tRNA ligase n=1 Tax=Aquisediminimonas profunda TaxID=1550733 RepID=UPI001C629F10|nr:valine--tRNA ligase [Aquisediminimonas profunda]
MTELAKTFDPSAIESKWYRHWEATGAFRPSRPDAEPFTIVMPPPNVTGSLHIGHALDNTLQDVLIRHARLQGKDALWVCGTDHAGIATQMVVERQLNERQQKRTDFSREDFIAKVWEWKAESGGAITGQLRRLGASCDWTNERFTMDEGFSKAVIKVFVELYNEGLLYRDKRLVNWDPGLKTAISDLEVETVEINGKFWHLKYPLEDGSGHISVATTRPETMLADMAVAVNGDDPRYTAVIGKLVRLPITGRLIPVIADEHADPELGSGAVKITPGHDFNDFEVGKRAGFKPADMLNMFDAEARVIQTADDLIPAELLGLPVKEARERVVALIEAAGLLEKVEDRVIQTPFGDRSGAVIEPWLTDQWYVDAKTLAQPAIEAVRTGAINVVPQTWEKTYFNWMENIQPWCVSRQLWWGHQIPAWFTDDGTVFVAENEAEAQALAGAGVTLTRDPDVLDTWFSSALWPFGTLGWPEESSTLHRHYPNDVLISGFDILFFWDARMAMQGLHFMKEVPWKTLYLHGLVRAADGSKMSKSKGNTVDPLGLIDQFGADALRFTLTAMESQGRDIKLDEKRVEGYRNFATKLWNAARFCQSNGIGASTTLAAPRAELAVNRWIIGETVETLAKLDRAVADLRYDAMADAIYHFAWGTFCDWYLELIKGEMGEETKAVAGWVLDQILVMLHPFMPFITEELWHAMGQRSCDLIHAQWPNPQAKVDSSAKDEVEWLISLVGAVRAAKNELGIPPGAKLSAYVRDASEETLARLERQMAAIGRLARLDSVSGSPAPQGGAIQLVVEEATFVLPLAGVIDLDAERARITKSIEALSKERDALAGRLNNPAFVEKAKPEAVDKARADHAEKAAEVDRLTAALARLD